MITADFHLHSSFSGDCDTPMEDMIQKGLSVGLTTMCFTEHVDYDYPDCFPPMDSTTFLLNVDSYLYHLLTLKEKYAKKINLLFGVELGLQPSANKQNITLVQSYPFDFIIGSSHLCHGIDIYFPVFYEGRTDREAYQEYFESIYENISTYSDFDVYGHLDYVVRYGPTKDANYCYQNHGDILDAILTKLVSMGKGLEINTGGLRRGLREANPSTAILKRYKELGGEIITVGSDAHFAKHVGSDFDVVNGMLQDCGFEYYCVFKNRMPEFIKI